jgi:hypothetical protein
MVNTTDFEKRFFLYKTEGKNMLIQIYCVNNSVNYQAYYKNLNFLKSRINNA